MPLRDHFHIPWNEQNPWESFHSAWINTMVRHLNGNLLPEPYQAIPRVSLINDVFEVRVREIKNGRRVAAIRLVAPANKDGSRKQRKFVTACTTDLRAETSVITVDIVTA